jgi:hypothetical protein
MSTEAFVSRHPAVGVHRWWWVLALVLTLLLVPRAQAYPISPQTLWHLTQKAELVVWADVEDVAPLPPPPTDGGTEDDFRSSIDVARLKVREVWKGNAPEGGPVEVHFNSGIICPAPPHYEAGLSVVAFLARYEGKWRTVGLSYGTRYPTSTGEAEAYKRAITQAHEAQQEAAPAPDGGVALEEPGTDWLVLAASHPATRWDGLYGLVPESDEYLFFYDQRGSRPVSLTGEQREQLARGFVEHPPLDRSLSMMLAALRGHANAEVDRVAANALETLLADGRPPYWAPLALDLLRERHGEKPKKRPANTEDPLLRGRDGKAPSGLHPLVKEWKAFKKRHKLEPQRLALPVEPPVPGTGGDTPL